MQVLHYMAVTGYPRAQLIALIGNRAIIERTVERDEEAIAAIEEQVDRFWTRCVEANKQPLPRTLDADLEELIESLCYDPLAAPMLEEDEQ